MQQREADPAQVVRRALERAHMHCRKH
jgi:hypothetical protein